MKTLLIEGMMCPRCVKHVEDTLNKIGTNVKVSLEKKQATLNTEANDQTIKDLIEEAGYEVVEIING